MTRDEYKEQKYELQIVINWLSKHEKGYRSHIVEHNTTGFGIIKPLYDPLRCHSRCYLLKACDIRTYYVILLESVLL